MKHEQSAAAVANKQQSFGAEPLEVRESNHYQAEYVTSFVERWDELIDWDGRAASEGDFFIEALREHGAKHVLDVATGTGFHSVQLMRAGFDVVSVDGNPNMLAKAFSNARDRDLILQTVHSDWRWLCRDIVGRYDAVICLGNSFTHLFSEHQRRRVLAEFYSVLKHDGILILDQRNYDALLDNKGSGPSHEFYYCGEDVKAEPEHVDEGLARFRYTFADRSVFHLNMYPLRRDYVRRLMREVGFQKVDTYGDFQESYRQYEPDFFVHVANKAFLDNQDQGTSYSEVVETARSYYNSDDADTFYYEVWGGEDIHIGLYLDEAEPIRDASRRTVRQMASQLKTGGTDTQVIDLGGAYGGSPRYIAEQFGCQVVSLNLSEVQNQRARQQNEAAGLSDKITVIDGDFEAVPYDANRFDIVWSQDSFLHSGNRAGVLAEIQRILKPGGELIFTDPMQTEDASRETLQPVLDRIQLESMGSPRFYEQTLGALGFEKIAFDDHSDQLPRHYCRVRQELESRYDELLANISRQYLDNMIRGLNHWVDNGNAGNLCWGIYHFRLPA